MLEITGTIREIWERVKEVFSNLYTKAKDFFTVLTEKFNITSKFLHNVHMMRFTKKKRVRKKYAKLVFR